MGLLDIGAGASEGLDKLVARQMLQERLDREQQAMLETVRHNKASEANVAAGIEATKGYRDAMIADTQQRIQDAQKQRDLTRTLGRVALRPVGTEVTPMERQQEIEAGAPPQLYEDTVKTVEPDMTSQPAGSTFQGASALPIINFRGTQAEADKARTAADAEYRSSLTAQHNADTLDLATTRLQLERERLANAQKAKDAKADELKVSAGGKRGLSSIDQAQKMIPAIEALIKERAPDIETNPEKYNTWMDLGKNVGAYGMYKLGFKGDESPLIQLTKLLQPIQAGQFLVNSRSRQMLDLALSHLSDPMQTTARQHEALQTLKNIMPELKQAILESEKPVSIKSLQEGGGGDDNDPMGLGLGGKKK